MIGLKIRLWEFFGKFHACQDQQNHKGTTRTHRGLTPFHKPLRHKSAWMQKCKNAQDQDGGNTAADLAWPPARRLALQDKAGQRTLSVHNILQTMETEQLRRVLGGLQAQLALSLYLYEKPHWNSCPRHFDRPLALKRALWGTFWAFVYN